MSGLRLMSSDPTTCAAGRFGCPMCGCTVTERVWGGGECTDCGSVSAARMPLPGELAAFYARYNLSYLGGGRSEGRNLARYAARYLELVSTVASQGRLVDVGSSNNPFPNHAQEAGFDVTVVDYARPQSLVSGVQYIKGNLNDPASTSSLDGSFDVVTAWAVIEHLPSPREAARQLVRLCRPGGWIVLSTPEAGTALTDHSIGRSAWFYPPEHLCLQSPRAIARVYRDAGACLRTWGRLELTSVRLLARNGVGVVEASVGWPLQRLWPRAWQALRDRVKHRFQGITYFVIERLA